MNQLPAGFEHRARIESAVREALEHLPTGETFTVHLVPLVTAARVLIRLEGEHRAAVLRGVGGGYIAGEIFESPYADVVQRVRRWQWL